MIGWAAALLLQEADLEQIKRDCFGPFAAQVRIVRSESLPVYTICPRTSIETREWKVVRVPFEGQSVPPKGPTPDLWSIETPAVRNPDERWRLPVAQSAEVKVCPDCHGTKESPCADCKAAGKFPCNFCEQKGTKTCPHCKGQWERRCSSCAGKGWILKRPCTSCSATGYNNCAACKKGIWTCELCKGDGIRECASCEAKGKKWCVTCAMKGKVVESLEAGVHVREVMHTFRHTRLPDRWKVGSSSEFKIVDPASISDPGLKKAVEEILAKERTDRVRSQTVEISTLPCVLLEYEMGGERYVGVWTAGKLVSDDSPMKRWAQKHAEQAVEIWRQGDRDKALAMADEALAADPGCTEAERVKKWEGDRQDMRRYILYGSGALLLGFGVLAIVWLRHRR